ncbi:MULTISPECIES: citrate synthase [unclassified Pseudofrankia]|uniref:citrate synthase n=1 Tax=unclassified Pseudofrankia TaxID=2994372 RepID=UPI001041BFD7|nr:MULTISPECIES: citrate synthase [unclassified Pseudofrankia]MDT3440803.1 citrate synthase [Pseudofrankia sp. BMG5.37]
MTARAAAERLGVDVRTLYAYVSRGSLTRAGIDEKRRSLYDADEVELLARHGRPRTHRRSRAGIDVAVGSAVSTIEPGRISYRGHDLGRLLADETPFEDVAELIWSGGAADRAPWSLPADIRAAATVAVASLGEQVGPLARMAVAVAAAAPLLRGPVGDLETGRRLVALLAESAGGPASGSETPDGSPAAGSVGPFRWGGRAPGGRPGEREPPSGEARVGSGLSSDGARAEPFPLARGLWARLSPLASTPPRVRALNRALVVLADHELATSTLAARIAASVRSDLPACVLTALGTLDGELHGRVSDLVHRLLLDLAEPGLAAPDLAPLRRLATVQPSHLGDDPRTAPLLEAVRRMAGAAERATMDQFLAHARDSGALSSVDVALGVLCYVGRLPPGSAPAIFATARCVGWVAHVREEFEERPLRFRGRAVARPEG